MLWRPRGVGCMNEDLIHHRLERSAEALKDAEILLSEKRLHATVNRLYYSMFYAVVALLDTKGLGSSKHSGVLAMFNQNFVNTGSVSKEAGDFYGTMFATWQKDERAEHTEFADGQVEEYFAECGLRLNEMRTIIYEIMGWRTEGT
jgi:uncharacterized protein